MPCIPSLASHPKLKQENNALIWPTSIKVIRTATLNIRKIGKSICNLSIHCTWTDSYLCRYIWQSTWQQSDKDHQDEHKKRFPLITAGLRQSNSDDAAGDDGLHPSTLTFLTFSPQKRTRRCDLFFLGIGIKSTTWLPKKITWLTRKISPRDKITEKSRVQRLKKGGLSRPSVLSAAKIRHFPAKSKLC